MKRLIKTLLCVFVTFIALIVTLLFCFTYETKYKKTILDTAISPDKRYELILEAIGEADWPFGSARGQLILKEGKNKLSQAGFELYNDGKSITRNCWKVTWHKNYVEVILSGEEQLDEQILLYFNGEKEIQQLTNEFE